MKPQMEGKDFDVTKREVFDASGDKVERSTMPGNMEVYDVSMNIGL